MSEAKATISRDEIVKHCEMIHHLAVSLRGQGTIVIAAFGEDPEQIDPRTGKPGRRLPQCIEHFEIGHVDRTAAAIGRLAARPHYNVYMATSVMRPDLPAGRKGTETDVVGCLGIVADFDDDNAANWSHRVPVHPNYVLETSQGRFQAFFLLDQPEPLATVKPVAERLKTFAHCDHGTSDLSHVWRVPGCPNWPNSKKLSEGRSLEPQQARVVQPWTGYLISFAELAAALPEPRPAELEQPGVAEYPEGAASVSVDLLMQRLPRSLRDAIIGACLGDRSKMLFHVVKMLGRAPYLYGAEQIQRIIEAHPRGIGEKYADRDDLAKEIDRILKKQSTDRRGAEPITAELEAELEAARAALGIVISEFNSQYAVVNEHGKAVVYERTIDPILDRSILVRIEFADLKKLYQNRRITMPSARRASVTKSAAEWWLDSPHRRQFLGGVVFDPTGSAAATCWNLWSGFLVEPKQGDWTRMRDHILEVICAGNQDHAEYVLNWLARTFQYPNRPGEVALVLRGLKGTGKGILCNWIIKAWGAHGIHITNVKHLVGNFNAHLRDCVALFADEAFFAGDKQHEGVLKGLITEPTLPIEAKYQNVIQVTNMLHVMMASNQDWVVPASHDERRYLVLDVAGHRIGDREYFAALTKQMEDGGLAAMIHELLQRDISKFEVRDFPNTPALADQKKHSLDSLHKWWLAVLERGYLYKSRHGVPWFTDWHAFYSTELLARSYQQWCDETRPYDRKTRFDLGRMMTDIYIPHRPGAGNPQPIHEIDSVDVDPILKHDNWLDHHAIVRKERPTGYIVGDLEESQARFTQMCGVVGDWA